MRESITVKHELLRKSGTETGISFPKYYAWIRIFEGDRLIEEGAVRVAKTDDKKFDVTHYVAKSEIAADTSVVYQIFPKDLADELVAKVKSKSN